MPDHVLTSSEMTALGDFVFQINGVQGTDTVASTAHTVADWDQEFNDALRSVDSSIFGHSYAHRPAKPPFPPKNVDGDKPPPPVSMASPLNDVAHSFVGLTIEVAIEV